MHRYPFAREYPERKMSRKKNNRGSGEEGGQGSHYLQGRGCYAPALVRYRPSAAGLRRMTSIGRSPTGLIKKSPTTYPREKRSVRALL